MIAGDDSSQESAFHEQLFVAKITVCAYEPALCFANFKKSITINYEGICKLNGMTVPLLYRDTVIPCQLLNSKPLHEFSTLYKCFTAMLRKETPACQRDLAFTVRIKIDVCNCLPNTDWRLKCTFGSSSRRVFTKLCSHNVSLLSVCCTQRSFVDLHLPLSQKQELVGCNIGKLGPTTAVGAGRLLSQSARLNLLNLLNY